MLSIKTSKVLKIIYTYKINTTVLDDNNLSLDDNKLKNNRRSPLAPLWLPFGSPLAPLCFLILFKLK
jgi:hypothetical protein